MTVDLPKTDRLFRDRLYRRESVTGPICDAIAFLALRPLRHRKGGLRGLGHELSKVQVSEDVSCQARGLEWSFPGPCACLPSEQAVERVEDQIVCERPQSAPPLRRVCG